jgi:hypothetical protein
MYMKGHPLRAHQRIGVTFRGLTLSVHVLNHQRHFCANTRNTRGHCHAVLQAPSYWDVLYGNEGTMSAFNCAGRLLYFVTGELETGAVELGAVNVDSGVVVGHPPITGDVGLGASTLINIEFSTFADQYHQ